MKQVKPSLSVWQLFVTRQQETDMLKALIEDKHTTTSIYVFYCSEMLLFFFFYYFCQAGKLLNII